MSNQGFAARRGTARAGQAFLWHRGCHSLELYRVCKNKAETFKYFICIRYKAPCCTQSMALTRKQDQL